VSIMRHYSGIAGAGGVGSIAQHPALLTQAATGERRVSIPSPYILFDFHSIHVQWH
jgi:hypothetical protein